MRIKGTQFLLSFFLVAASSLSQANPSNPTVVSGSVSFDSGVAGTLDVYNSPGSIINWQDFSIGVDEITRFIQESNASTVLNRVTGGNLSQILGQLQSNGHVFLVNPAGILVGPQALIDAGSFTAGTLNLSDHDFLTGNFHFTAADAMGAILNQGMIRAGANGDILLIAPDITNEGTITSDGGSITLAAGSSMLMTDLDTPEIQFELQSADDTVLNLGTLSSAGGAIDIFAGTIEQRGVVSVSSASLDGAGNIRLMSSGDNLNYGTAEAIGENGNGGEIQLLGDRVGVMDGATVDASGATGGGAVYIGGSKKGEGPLPNASAIAILPEAVVQANAIENGDGGTIIAYGTDFAKLHGTLVARGGANGGDGGFIETSAHGYLDIAKTPDISASAGNNGTWLIDPVNVSIVAAGGGSTDIDIQPNSPATGDTTFSANGNDSSPDAGLDTVQLGVDLIQAALTNNATVVVDSSAAGGTGDGRGILSLDTVFDLDNNAGATSTLQFISGGTNGRILIDQDIINTSGINNMNLQVRSGGSRQTFINANIDLGDGVFSTLTGAGTQTVSHQNSLDHTLFSNGFNVDNLSVSGGGKLTITSNDPSKSTGTIGTLSVASGTLDARYPLTMTELNWTGGTIADSATTFGTLNFTDDSFISGNVVLDGLTLFNRGALLEWQAGDIDLVNGAGITNTDDGSPGGGTFQINGANEGGTSMTLQSSDSSGTLLNANGASEAPGDEATIEFETPTSITVTLRDITFTNEDTVTWGRSPINLDGTDINNAATSIFDFDGDVGGLDQLLTLTGINGTEQFTSAGNIEIGSDVTLNDLTFNNNNALEVTSSSGPNQQVTLNDATFNNAGTFVSQGPLSTVGPFDIINGTGTNLFINTGSVSAGNEGGGTSTIRVPITGTGNYSVSGGDGDTFILSGGGQLGGGLSVGSIDTFVFATPTGMAQRVFDMNGSDLSGLGAAALEGVEVNNDGQSSATRFFNTGGLTVRNNTSGTISQIDGGTNSLNSIQITTGLNFVGTNDAQLEIAGIVAHPGDLTLGSASNTHALTLLDDAALTVVGNVINNGGIINLQENVSISADTLINDRIEIGTSGTFIEGKLNKVQGAGAITDVSTITLNETQATNRSEIHIESGTLRIDSTATSNAINQPVATGVVNLKGGTLEAVQGMDFAAGTVQGYGVLRSTTLSDTVYINQLNAGFPGAATVPASSTLTAEANDLRIFNLGLYDDVTLDLKPNTASFSLEDNTFQQAGSLIWEAGTLTTTGGTLTTLILPVLDPGGSLESIGSGSFITTGTKTLDGLVLRNFGNTNWTGGDIVLSNNARIELFPASGSFSPTGVLNVDPAISGTTLNINGGAGTNSIWVRPNTGTGNDGKIDLNDVTSGVLNINVPLILSGDLEVTNFDVNLTAGGLMRSAGAQGTMTLNSNRLITFDGGSFDITYGTFAGTAGKIRVINGAALTNDGAAAGSGASTVNSALEWELFDGSLTGDPADTLNVTATNGVTLRGGSTFSLDANMDTTRFLALIGATLNLGSNATLSTDSFAAANTAVVNLNGGDLTVRNGAGTPNANLFAGSTLNIGSGSTLTLNAFSQTNVAGTLNVNGGTLDLNGNLTNTATGTLTMSSGQIAEDGEFSTLTNQAGGTVNLNGGSYTTTAPGSTPSGSGIVNQGLFSINGLTSLDTYLFNNTGTVVKSGASTATITADGGAWSTTPFTNAGTLTIAGGTLILDNNQATNAFNQTAGTTTFTGDGATLRTAGDLNVTGGAITINGAGTISATLDIQGGASALNQLTVDNGDNLDVTSTGQISATNVNVTTGTLDVTSGGDINITNATLDANTTLDSSGDGITIGTLDVTGANVTITAPQFASTTAATLDGNATLNLDLSGTSPQATFLGFTWDDAQLVNANAGVTTLDLRTDGASVWQGTAAKVLNDIDWTNKGTINWNSGSTLTLNGGSDFVNDGDFNVNNVPLARTINDGTGSFTNLSTVTMNVNDDLTFTGTPFTNDGSGTLNIGSGATMTVSDATLDGGINVSGAGSTLALDNSSNGITLSTNIALAGGAVSVAGGTLNLDGTTDVTGNGQVVVDGGILSTDGTSATPNTFGPSVGVVLNDGNIIATGADNGIADYDFQGGFSTNTTDPDATGTINAHVKTTSLTVTDGAMELGSGTLELSVSATIASGATLSITGGTFIEDDATVTNSGIFNYTGGSYQTAAGVTSGGITNTATGTMTVADSTLTTFSLDNMGGTMSITDGTLTLGSGPFTNSGGLTTTGTVSLNQDFGQSAGSTTLDGTFNVAGAVNVTGGTVGGAGTLQSADDLILQAASFNGDTTLTSTGGTVGATSLSSTSGTLDVAGNTGITLGTISTTGNTTIGSATGTTTTGNVTSTGGSLDISGDGNVSTANLTTAGNTSVTSTSGSASTSNVTVTGGSLTMAGSTGVSSGAIVSTGDTTLTSTGGTVATGDLTSTGGALSVSGGTGITAGDVSAATNTSLSGGTGSVTTADLGSGSGSLTVAGTQFNVAALDLGGSSTDLSGVNTVNANTVTSSSDIAISNTLTTTGGLTQTGGTLDLTGGTINGNVTVNGGTFKGSNATVTGNVTVNSGGVLAPGSSPGVTNYGSLTLNTGSLTIFEIFGFTQGTTYDLINVAGNADVLPGAQAQLVFGSFTPPFGTPFTLISYGSANTPGPFTVFTSPFLAVQNFNANAFVAQVGGVTTTPTPTAQTEVLVLADNGGLGGTELSGEGAQEVPEGEENTETAEEGDGFLSDSSDFENTILMCE